MWFTSASISLYLAQVNKACKLYQSTIRRALLSLLRYTMWHPKKTLACTLIAICCFGSLRSAELEDLFSYSEQELQKVGGKYPAQPPLITIASLKDTKLLKSWLRDPTKLARLIHDTLGYTVSMANVSATCRVQTNLLLSGIPLGKMWALRG